MKNSPEISARAQIRNLLIVIASGVFFAFAIAILMLGVYGPTGRYTLQNVLLSPETATKLNYEGFVFDHVEYSMWNPESKRWNRQNISLPLYQKFYAAIEADQSLQEVSAAVDELFSKNPTALTIFLRRQDKSSHPQLKSFQTVQFGIDGNYYRVELRTDNSNKDSPWAYFYHADLASHFLQFFAQDSEEF